MTNSHCHRRNLLQRVYRFWARRLSMPFGIASSLCAALQIGHNPHVSRKARLPAQCVAPKAVTFLCLPRNLQEEILRLLPTKDRVRAVPLVCTQLTATTRADCPIWEELVIDAQVLGTCLNLDVLEAWLVTRGPAVSFLTIKDLKTWSEQSTESKVASLSTGVISRIFIPCQACLKSLTITECGSLFAEADFAALAALHQLQTLCIHTAAQVHPCSVASLSSLTRLSSLSLMVAPGNRMDYGNISKYSGNHHSLMSLSTLTTLSLSGWTYLGRLPEAISSLSQLRELEICNCAMTSLPASLGRLSHLERIDFHSNALGRSDDFTPADCLHGCTNLTSIKLSGNYFASVPAFLSSATALRCLHLANNHIGSSGNTACLAALTALTKLVMQQCGLNTVPDSFAALSNLQWLCMSRNSLSSIPDGLPWGKLTLLHLRGNELGAVPCSALASAAQLHIVDCGENPPLQVNDYLKIWAVIKVLPLLHCLLIDKTGGESMSMWTPVSACNIAALKKLMKKRKRRVLLDPAV
ncbi:hypothetical protein ABBQ32_003604 [Trebouxia sp. C0010 RCD-2024]